MAQDYHIYLHSEGNGSSGNNTTPFNSRIESRENSSSGYMPTVKTAFNTTKGIAQGNAVNLGVAALSKVAPAIAVMVALIHITDKVLTTGFAHQEEYTGNYKNNATYNNIKATASTIFHPVRFYFSLKHQEAQFNKQNKEIAQQNRLIGNSILKDFNIGV